MNNGRNLPLADQLREVREAIKMMRGKEQVLVEDILDAGGDRGAFATAVVQESERRNLDTKAVRKHLGDDVSRFESVKQVKQVRLEIHGDD